MSWHLSKYAAAVDSGGELLLYHSLTGALLKLTDEDKLAEMRAILAGRAVFQDGKGDELTEALRELKYIFPDHIDETETAKQMFIDRAAMRDTLHLMIYVTNACNFRCEYCPQPHTEEYMSLSTIDEVCAAVERHALTNPIKRIVISWFGGEPLLNMPVIRRGMTRLGELCREGELVLQAGMTTNGYALSAELFEELIGLGVNSFQITLDGTAEAHDRSRTLRGGGATWQRIWDNLLYIKSTRHDFTVVVRSNVNPGNAESAKALFKLKREMLDRRFVLQVQPITNMGGLGAESEAYCSASEAENVQLEMYGVLGALGESGFGRISTLLRPFGMMCSCADKNYLIIKTDGSVCKCELLVDDERNLLGKVEDGSFRLNDETLAQYIAPSFSDECCECTLFPLCYGLNCPHKKATKYGCTLRQSFDLPRNVRLLAEGLSAMRQKK